MRRRYRAIRYISMCYWPLCRYPRFFGHYALWTVISLTVTADGSFTFSSRFKLCRFGPLFYMLPRQCLIAPHATWTVIYLTATANRCFTFSLRFWLSRLVPLGYLLPIQCFFDLMLFEQGFFNCYLRVSLSCLESLVYLLPTQCFDYNCTRWRLSKKRISRTYCYIYVITASSITASEYTFAISDYHF